jgi:thiamine biosynthesis lipoprotein
MKTAQRTAIAVLILGCLFAVAYLRQTDRATGPEEVLFAGPTMGTTYSVKLVSGPLAPDAREEIGQAIATTLEGVNQSMSTYLVDSELSRFNRHGIDPFPASPELLEVMAEAQRVSRLSGGAFDITVAPLVDAWGFGPTPRTEPPGDGQIAELLAGVGYEGIRVDLQSGTLQKTRPELSGDLSGIAKGYAVDRVARALEALGHGDYAVEVGGEVRARGRNAAGRGWQVGVERPEAGRRALQEVISLIDAALASSGEYRNFYERDGARISHTIDPRTGRPVSHEPMAVTVLDSACMTADAWATALNVLGPVEGFELAESLGLAALFIVASPDGDFRALRTTAFSALDSITNTTAE